MKTKKFKLPEINIQENIGLKIVNKSISITAILIVTIIVLSLFIINLYQIDLTVESQGVLEPSNINRVYCNEGGILKEVFINTGEKINVGKTLAVFDTSSAFNRLRKNLNQIKELKLSKQEFLQTLPFERNKLQNKIEEANSNILEADLAIREKLVEFYPGEQRDSILKDYKIGNHISLDKAYIRKKKAEIHLKNAELEKEKLKLKKFDVGKIDLNIERLQDENEHLKFILENNKVISAEEGIVLSEELDKMKGKMFNKGDLLFEYSNLNSWKVNLIIPENEIHNIKLGDSVKIEINALNLENDQKLYGGIVSYVATDLFSNPNLNSGRNNNYKVSTLLDLSNFSKNEIDKLRRGYTAKANIITDSGTISKLLIKYFRKLL